MRRPEEIDPLLAEQIAYYRTIAMEYQVDGDAARELAAALAAYQPAGRVLELACGPGAWTELLLRYATSVTAIDAAPEMLARAKARVGAGRVRFIQADLFSWTPDQRYDFVFFGFWLSHVPLDRFESFWSMVADSLAPAGRVFFVDDNARTPQELIEGESSTTIRRCLNDGAGFRLVKVPYQPAELEERLGRLGWRITVTPTSGPFFWGAGSADPARGKGRG
jgi:demethylmenaquinone methyltransferase/2-methoxy-6-polyprenyl-1,4-benzoquinol methylase